MQAMILAAGKGERMRPLSLHTPKPLLQAGGKPLLQYHIESLAAASVDQIVINTGRLGEMIQAWFGEGDSFGVHIHYSHEGEEPLGTGGGIRKALPLLGDAPFILVNGDIWTEFDYRSLPASPGGLAHLVMVDNPAHNPDGDFALKDGLLSTTGQTLHTYSGIGVYDPQLFSRTDSQLFSLVPLLKQAMLNQQVSGQYFKGKWFDIGTLQRLTQLDRLLAAKG
jgi:MurNAc alpha-1-phosphate uridylyltransferase